MIARTWKAVAEAQAVLKSFDTTVSHHEVLVRH